MEFSSANNGVITNPDAVVSTHIFSRIMTPQHSVHHDTSKPFKEFMEQFHQELQVVSTPSAVFIKI